MIRANLCALVLLFMASTFCAIDSFGQDIPKKQYETVKIGSPPVIDGLLDDAAWLSGEWIDSFTQYEPYNDRPASQRTEFKIVHDQDNIYVAFRAFDTNPDSIVSRLSRRDDVDGDLVAVMFDSYHDLRTAFVFGISAAGVKYDFMMTDNGQNEDDSWNPNWWTKTSVNAEGWEAEMKIPFSQVRFEGSSDGVWGLEVVRYVYRHKEKSFWQHVPKDAPGMVANFGEITGLDNIKPRKVLDITPYTVGKLETYKKVPENPFLADGNKASLNGGIDAKVGLTNNLTMDLTINPDFGQVEADPSQINLSAFETYFSEKRNFFIEGNNITSYNLGIGDGSNGNDNLFYSRRIGRSPHGSATLEEGWYANTPTSTTILGAAKVTGKTDKGLSIGVMEAITGNEYATVDTIGGRISQLVEPVTNYFVGRVRKDFNEGNAILGGIVTAVNRDLDASNQDYLHESAYTGGIDYLQYFNEKKWELSLSAAISRVAGTKEAIQLTQKSSARYFQRPDATHTEYDPNRTSLFGSGGRARITKLDGHFTMMGAVTWKTPGFEVNDLGYMRSADQMLTVLWAGYNEWEPKSFYRNYNFGGDVYMVNDFEGNILSRGFEYNGNAGFKNYWNAWFSGNINAKGMTSTALRGGPMERIPGSTYFGTGFSTDSRKDFQFSSYININRGFEKTSNSFSWGFGLEYIPVKYVSLELDPGFSRSFNELQYVTGTSYNGDQRYIMASINQEVIRASFRVNLNITPDMTFQYWGQPFMATGDYSDYKYITNSLSDIYQDRFHVYTGDEIALEDDDYQIDENNDGTTDYTAYNGDYNTREFLSNLMFRWEYNPGSTVYVVWSQSRDYFDGTGEMEYFDNLGELFNRGICFPNNVFLIKFSYRFGIR